VLEVLQIDLSRSGGEERTGRAACGVSLGKLTLFRIERAAFNLLCSPVLSETPPSGNAAFGEPARLAAFGFAKCGRRRQSRRPLPAARFAGSRAPRTKPVLPNCPLKQRLNRSRQIYPCPEKTLMIIAARRRAYTLRICRSPPQLCYRASRVVKRGMCFPHPSRTAKKSNFFM